MRLNETVKIPSACQIQIGISQHGKMRSCKAGNPIQKYIVALFPWNSICPAPDYCCYNREPFFQFVDAFSIVFDFRNRAQIQIHIKSEIPVVHKVFHRIITNNTASSLLIMVQRFRYAGYRMHIQDYFVKSGDIFIIVTGWEQKICPAFFFV